MQWISLKSLFKEELIINKAVIRTIGILVFLWCMAFGAFVYLPLPWTPVPITLQTFFVLLCAVFLRKSDALLTQGLYLGLGAAGLPLFSGAQGGILRLFGPTGGYIIGFSIACVFVRLLLDYCSSKQKTGFVTIFSVMCCGIAVIYLFGILGLIAFTHLSFPKVIIFGVIPFIAGDILKAGAAALVYRKLRVRINCPVGGRHA
ncbi:MAG: biotin transporter BioY [Candidatus Omnitrophota bacterium]|nr:MAG: biotin transporter BioY [Candidatus Omnitrophota bacterium]